MRITQVLGKILIFFIFKISLILSNTVYSEEPNEAQKVDTKDNNKTNDVAKDDPSAKDKRGDDVDGQEKNNLGEKFSSLGGDNYLDNNRNPESNASSDEKNNEYPNTEQKDSGYKQNESNLNSDKNQSDKIIDKSLDQTDNSDDSEIDLEVPPVN